MLTNEQLRYRAPAIFADAPESDVSERYNFIKTIDVLDGLRDMGWLPVDAQQVKARTISRADTGVHMIKMEHPDIEPIGGTKVQALVINSHNRQRALTGAFGAIEFACANGLISGDMFNSIRIMHSSRMIAEAVESFQQVIANAPKMMDRIQLMRDVELTPEQRLVFARSALNYRYGAHGTADQRPLVAYGSPRQIDLVRQQAEHDGRQDEEIVYIPVRPEQMLQQQRNEQDPNSLWRTFNIIQENIIRGGAVGLNENYRRTRTKEIKAIDSNVKTNKALWNMAEFLADTLTKEVI